MKILFLDLVSYIVAYLASSIVFHKIEQNPFSVKGDVIPFIVFYLFTRYLWFLTTLMALVSTVVDIVRGRYDKWKGMH